MRGASQQPKSTEDLWALLRRQGAFIKHPRWSLLVQASSRTHRRPRRNERRTKPKAKKGSFCFPPLVFVGRRAPDPPPSRMPLSILTYLPATYNPATILPVLSGSHTMPSSLYAPGKAWQSEVGR